MPANGRWDLIRRLKVNVDVPAYSVAITKLQRVIGNKLIEHDELYTANNI